MNLNTYYPAPFGAYERLRLVPQAPVAGACNFGTIYVENATNTVQFCNDTNTFGRLPGVWMQDGDNVFLTDTADPNIRVNIGDSNPYSWTKLHLTYDDITDPTTLSIQNTSSDGIAQIIIGEDTPPSIDGFIMRYNGLDADNSKNLRFMSFINNPATAADVMIFSYLGTFARFGIPSLQTDTTLGIQGDTSIYGYPVRSLLVRDSNSNSIFDIRNDGATQIGSQIFGMNPDVFAIQSDNDTDTVIENGILGTIHIIAQGPAAFDGKGKITFSPDSTQNTAWASIGASFDNSPTTRGRFHFSTRSGPVYNLGMTLDAEGNVGIGAGTSEMNARLEVRGPTLLNAHYGSIAGDDISYLNSSGKLLIGWNRSGGHGETDFIANSGPAGGEGGFDFIDFTGGPNPAPSVERSVMRISNPGLIRVGLFSGSADSPLSISPSSSGGSPAEIMSFKDAATGNTRYHLNYIATGLQFVETSGLATRMFMEFGGRVGFGTTTPQARLEVVGNTIFNSGFANLNGADISFLNNTAKLLIGWNRSGGRGEADFITNRGAGGQGGFKFIDYDNADVENTLVSMLGNGNVGIGILTPNATLDINGNFRRTGSITQVSDERLKENIEIVKDPLEKLENIRGFYFNKIGSKHKEIGVSAQDVQKSLPEIVRVVDEESEYLGVNYLGLVPVLIEAVKELKNENNELREESKRLHAEFELLEARID